MKIVSRVVEKAWGGVFFINCWGVNIAPAGKAFACRLWSCRLDGVSYPGGVLVLVCNSHHLFVIFLLLPLSLSLSIIALSFLVLFSFLNILFDHGGNQDTEDNCDWGWSGWYSGCFICSTAWTRCRSLWVTQWYVALQLFHLLILSFCGKWSSVWDPLFLSSLKILEGYNCGVIYIFKKTGHTGVSVQLNEENLFWLLLLSFCTIDSSHLAASIYGILNGRYWYTA